MKNLIKVSLLHMLLTYMQQVLQRGVACIMTKWCEDAYTVGFAWFHALLHLSDSGRPSRLQGYEPDSYRAGELLSATGNVYRFPTNDFTHSYLTIAELYRERWQVECFIKWIKLRTG